MRCKVYVTAALMCASAAAWTSTPPPCDGASFRQFDFWLGQWQVLTADGKEAGFNRITAAERGCVLEERWRGSQGGTSAGGAIARAQGKAPGLRL